ncbi:MAG: HAD family phosphatase [Candidatus Micrarchaeota archaeon]
MIKGVLFDFDGVLVRSEPLHKETFMELLRPYGVQVSDERWYSEFAGTGSRHIFEVLVNEYKLGLDFGELVERRKRLYESRVRSGQLEAMPGAQEFILALKEQRIKTAIVSGSHRTNVRAALETLRLGPVDAIVSGDDLEKRKPDPAPFLKGAQILGLGPGKCLVLEDSLSGCEAARRAGMRLVFVRPKIAIDPGAYDLEIEDFTGDDLKALWKLIGQSG